ncbi:uncharacterized protein GLRG_11584 [Colletotrichum graminicola M1.001]|uniref:GPI anchored protein n=1 Tax=Colletotrichum graminicola (strain M1.001 / M2 / FGSC 10212) TaxID=645133 RepID=E3R001_COLGM|nr:uncharacterized protein GLRG_11584 [Colletotrichum graminicola M1.001]EFQ36439.1 hypothetical protein GLRG_11584 [Colletotrichum graminicola M1.001]
MILFRAVAIISLAGLSAAFVDWRNATCSGPITDAMALPNLRWEAAGASAALSDLMDSWRNYSSGPYEVKFEFSQYASWYFGGPEMWRCTQLLDVPCSTSVSCEGTKYPAGHLILNSFSKLHQFHRRYWEALNQAQMDIQADMPLFAEKFSIPLPTSESQAQMQRIMLNVLYGVVGIAQAYANNFFVYSAVMDGFLGLSQTFRSQITTTTSYTIFTSWAIGKDYMLPGKAPEPAYGKLSAVMGSVFDQWKATEVAFLKNIFTVKDNETMAFLTATLDNGLMSAVPDDIDFREMAQVLKKVFYVQLMVSTWQSVADARQPFVLLYSRKTNLPYGDHARAATCYNGALFYLLDVRSQGVTLNIGSPSIRPSENFPFSALYGTETMDGVMWGGVTREDIVAAVYGAWVEGGRMNNNFNLNYTDVSPSQNSSLWVGQGIRLPGFVKLPLCHNLYTISCAALARLHLLVRPK